MEAVLGKLLFIAGVAVDIVALGHKALRADWLVALEAGEALLMPELFLVLHVLGACHTSTIRFT